ncbi:MULTISPECIES: adenylosuccinate synthetase [unclassified Bradyrhizobium]|uniref:adenylosuccinate synthetase n=1 Tax=unclassified Bradyrhizobium TaxID=2631580 RepID=UPI0029165726|nr:MULTISPECIES: adenylosuccinate synthetase [unclassified Bradyrhizobium]
MPISVVVGGQYGSEGKGKVALAKAREWGAEFVVRVGGTNSGHTAIDRDGRSRALRQLPVSMLAESTIAVLPPGALIDPVIFLEEVRRLELPPDRVIVSPFAGLISTDDKDSERKSGLVDQIGSTGSGTGAALIRRIGRSSAVRLAGDEETLRPYLGDTGALMRDALRRDRWIVIEGSQGFGLSLLHGGYYPHATSRDTTAAAFVSEAGLSPLDVREVVLVLRAHPIRVAGNSGPLQYPMTWEELAAEAGLPSDYKELTTATRKVRRIGRFEAEVARRAIEANRPTSIVLNHVDYVDRAVTIGKRTVRVRDFIARIEEAIGQGVDLVGTAPDQLVQRSEFDMLSEDQPAIRYSRSGL